MVCGPSGRRQVSNDDLAPRVGQVAGDTGRRAPAVHRGPAPPGGADQACSQVYTQSWVFTPTGDKVWRATSTQEGLVRRGGEPKEHLQSTLHKTNTHCPYHRPGRVTKTMEGGRRHFPVSRDVSETPTWWWVPVLPSSPVCLWVGPFPLWA